MLHLKTFESFKVKKKKKLKKHYSAGQQGTLKVVEPMEGNKLDNLTKLLKKVCKIFKVEKIRYEKSGMSGMAFFADEDKVIKLTSDKNEALNVEELIKKQKEGKVAGTIEYYDLIYFEDYEIWAILMERVKPLKSKDEDLYHVLLACTRLILIRINNAEVFGFTEEEFVDNIISSNEVLKKYKRSEVMEAYKLTKDLIEKLDSSGISMYDLHTGNIGWKGNELAHFDIMSEYTRDKDLIQIMSIEF